MSECKNPNGCLPAGGQIGCIQKCEFCEFNEVNIDMSESVELTFNTGFVNHWDIPKAFSEILQNAIDRQSKGNGSNDMSCSMHPYEGDTVRVLINNKNTFLDRQTLVMGVTEKGSNDIGGFGEGYKAAISVFLSRGFSVRVFTGSGLWSFELSKSLMFGCEVIKVIFDENSCDTESQLDLTFEISGLKAVDWESIRDSHIATRGCPPEGDFRTTYGEILTEHKDAGMIYINGLFICKKDNFHLGYNLRPNVITLDRDRKVTCSDSLALTTSRMWGEVLKEAGADSDEFKVASRLIKDKAKDVACLDDYARGEGYDVLCDAVYEEFMAEHGTDAIPYCWDSMKDKYSSDHSGVNPVYSNVNISHLVKSSPKFIENLQKTKLKEEDKKTPFNLLSKIYPFIKPFLSDKLKADFQDILNLSKNWS